MSVALPLVGLAGEPGQLTLIRWYDPQVGGQLIGHGFPLNSGQQGQIFVQQVVLAPVYKELS